MSASKGVIEEDKRPEDTSETSHLKSTPKSVNGTQHKNPCNSALRQKLKPYNTGRLKPIPPRKGQVSERYYLSYYGEPDRVFAPPGQSVYTRKSTPEEFQKLLDSLNSEKKPEQPMPTRVAEVDNIPEPTDPEPTDPEPTDLTMHGINTPKADA